MKLRTLLLLALLPAAPPAASAAEVEVLPAMRVRLEAARYAPSERDLRWTTWIGAGVTALRAGSWSFYGDAELETILGDELRTFDANQANYHLTLGARAAAGPVALSPFFHHVSRHYVDRPKERAVDWNVLGLRVSGTHDGTVPLSFHASVGKTTQASLPGYQWEVTGGAEAQLARWTGGIGYVRGALRWVIVEPDPEIPRGDFTDLSAEGGVRFVFGPRGVEAFVAFERRHDVFLEVPGLRDRALLGARFVLGGS
ncbi:MAG TPA: hypothetical protein VF310_13445 [Vicinamibacteria bacterium]